MGHAYTTIVCDILARTNRLQNKEVYFLTGSDENTATIIKTALEKNQTLEDYFAEIAGRFKDLYEKLDVSYDQFIQTSDKKRHWPGVITLWNKLVEAGDIYKSKYNGLYCTRCEAFYTEKDLVDGKCPLHLMEPQKIEEENYFFKLSKYTEEIKNKIENDEFKIIPISRKNEILSFLSEGLEDISFSRPSKVVPHGIPVPNDPDQKIYVWCDALTNYISALGYGGEDELFKKFWPVNVHVIGKDILRFHAAIWPGMLLSAGLPLPKSILVHGLITSGGHKMSKTLGNVIDPFLLINEYGKDAVRYYLAREISPFDDGDLTVEKFKESYNANLANGLGNLVSRIMKMATAHLPSPVEITLETQPDTDVVAYLEAFEINRAMDRVWERIGHNDALIAIKEPFRGVKSEDIGVHNEAVLIIKKLVRELYAIATELEPFMPETSAKIKELIKQNKMPAKPLFARKD